VFGGARMNRNRLLIIASYWNEDDVALFIAEHDEQPDKSFEKQLGEAFFAWAQTEEGRRFVESSGCNWGDALEIPDEILVKHGIHRFEQLIECIPTGTGPLRRRTRAFD